MTRVGIGGWVYEPWRKSFYPPGLKHADELNHASRHVTSIEINGTYYRSQTPSSFKKWKDETPEDFVFTVKGPRFATNRRILAEAEPSLIKFFESGVTELGSKLGPILWQFAPTKAFIEDDFSAFLELLPKKLDGHVLRHAVEVRHESFLSPNFIALLRRFRIPVVYADHPHYPAISDLTGDFVYARLQKSEESEATGYSKTDLSAWAKRAKIWSEGAQPKDLPHVTPLQTAQKPLDCFIFFIGAAKERNPAAAMTLLDLLKSGEPSRKKK